jgi:hypothetical protein
MPGDSPPEGYKFVGWAIWLPKASRFAGARGPYGRGSMNDGIVVYASEGKANGANGSRGLRGIVKKVRVYTVVEEDFEEDEPFEPGG